MRLLNSNTPDLESRAYDAARKEPARIIEERSWCDISFGFKVPKYHVEWKASDGWRDEYPLRRFDARLDAVREVYVSYSKQGIYRIMETAPSGVVSCVGIMDFGRRVPLVMRDSVHP